MWKSFAALSVALSMGVLANAQDRQNTTANNQASGGQANATQSQTGNQTDQSRAGQSQTGKTQTQTGQAGQSQPGQVRAGQTTTGQSRSNTDAGSNQVGQANRGGSGTDLGSMMATKLLLGNQEEVALSQVATQRASNAQVKQFAQQMVKDHSQAIEDLKRFAGSESTWKIEGVASGQSSRSGQGQADNDRQPGRDASSGQNRSDASNRNSTDQNESSRPGTPGANQRSTDQDNPNRSSTNRTGDQAKSGVGQAGNQSTTGDATRTRSDASEGRVTTSVATEGRHGGHSDQMLSIEREVCQRCLALTRAELEEHQGADFDKAFMSAQVAGHIGMIARLEAYEQHAPQELREVLQKSKSMAQHHLQQAKEIKMQLKSTSSSTTSDQKR